MESTETKKSNHGANVRRWREWRNINQEVLADMIGVSQTALSGYEKKDRLDQETLAKIAKALDVPVEAITELEQGTSINIISSSFTDFKDNAIASPMVHCQPTFNPIDKIVELYDQKIALYERMLKEKDEAIGLLHDVLKQQN